MVNKGIISAITFITFIASIKVIEPRNTLAENYAVGVVDVDSN